MKNKILTVLLALALAGCANMTERQKQTAWIVGGVVAGAVIISASNSGSSPAEQQCHFVMKADGSQFQVCR